MSANELQRHAAHFLSTARAHSECVDGRLIAADEESAAIELDMNVEMPLAIRVDGISPSGVRRTETVTVILDHIYPWSPPTFFLRDDFPRNLPHLQPSSLAEAPRPCLIDGNEREYFFRFGLLEAGIFHLIDQLMLWLQHAAAGVLIDPEQGWEPTLRRSLSSTVVLNAEACRALVDRNGGYRFLKARYFRAGNNTSVIGRDAPVFLDITDQQVPLSRNDNGLFRYSSVDDRYSKGDTVCCIAWPDKLPDGKPLVSSNYMPETITTFAALIVRANELGCGRALKAFLDGLERYFHERSSDPTVPVPVAVVICARRPFHLIGSTSDIELLPYVLDIRPSRVRTSLIAAGSDEHVAPAMQRDSANAKLLRTVSGAPEIAPVAILGCGSVGSKMAMHLARSGVTISVVSDRYALLPHNMARHALVRSSITHSKAQELALDIALLGQNPLVHEDDLVVDLSLREKRPVLLPKEAGYAVNTTASLAVREALSNLPAREVKPRLAEAALFGKGYGGFLLIDGAGHNPTHSDLVAELYATATNERLRSLLFDPAHGLTEVQIGQGCASLTMPMTDMRLSAMTAGLAEELVRAAHAPIDPGQIILAVTEDDSPTTTWSRQSVEAFAVVELEGADGWTMRLSQRVLSNIRAEMARYPEVETGGVLIGMCSARLRTVTVVDVLPAPPDSTRSATQFVLGTEGLQKAIEIRHTESGAALFDVGTWHSHLNDQGPSALDRKTAAELAAERLPPSALLIVAPKQLYGLMQKRSTAIAKKK